MSEEISMEESVPDEPQLYAGKFKTVEDLEKGYKESLGVHMKNKELESKLNEAASVPESYSVPDGIHLRDNKIKEMKELAKTAGMNQSQFHEAVKKVSNDVNGQLEAIQARREEIGEDKLSIMKKHIDSKFEHFDSSFRETALNKAIKDNQLMEKIMSERDSNLNSAVPGGNQVSSGYNNQANDMNKACYDAAIKSKMNPSDSNLRNKYISMCREVAHAKMDAQK